MYFSPQMFWQCDDVAKMYIWGGPKAVPQSSFWIKETPWEGPEKAVSLLGKGSMCSPHLFFLI